MIYLFKKQKKILKMFQRVRMNNSPGNIATK